MANLPLPAPPAIGDGDAEIDDAPTPPSLRAALGRFATGVTIVACRDAAGRPVGLTANSFAALSLQPPLVLWSLRKQSGAAPAFVEAPHFAVNVLAESQVELSRRFAAADDGRRFDDGPWGSGIGGAPVLGGSAAVFECRTVSCQDAGDHWLFIGRVLRVAEQALAPLVFQAGRYHLLGEVL